MLQLLRLTIVIFSEYCWGGRAPHSHTSSQLLLRSTITQSIIMTEGQYRYPEPAPDENYLSPSNCYNCKVQPHYAQQILLRHHFVGTPHRWSCQSYFYFGSNAKWFYRSVRAIQILHASLYRFPIKLAWKALKNIIFLAKWGKKVSSHLYSSHTPLHSHARTMEAYG